MRSRHSFEKQPTGFARGISGDSRGEGRGCALRCECASSTVAKTPLRIRFFINGNGETTRWQIVPQKRASSAHRARHRR